MFDRLTWHLALRGLRRDRFGTLAAILGVALGTATVNTVQIIDLNTERVESDDWRTNPRAEIPLTRTVTMRGLQPDGETIPAADVRQETHEDYEVMRSAIRLGSLLAFLVGALIVFFTFSVITMRRRKEVALLRSLGALPRQTAMIFILEAILIGAAGALVGLLLSVPLARVAAHLGITTTGRSHAAIIWIPRKRMLLVALIGMLTALLGVARPIHAMLRLDVPRALRPLFLSSADSATGRTAGVALVALPLTILLYGLMRPFFLGALPSLTFFVIEALAACAAFLLTLLLMPNLIRGLGSTLVRLFSGRTSALHLLMRRRIQHMGHDLTWSVSGIMLVFALLLALHIITHALRQEVVQWAAEANIRHFAFIYPCYGFERVPPDLTRDLPDQVVQVRFSGRTPWPNSIYAVEQEGLLSMAQATGDPQLVAIARRFTPGRILLSRLMARRLNVTQGDQIEIVAGSTVRRLEIIAVSNGLGYVPMEGPYRQSKTYALLNAADYDLIANYARPLGVALALVDPGSSRGVMNHAPDARKVEGTPRWHELIDGLALKKRAWTASMEITSGERFLARRVKETYRDFAIFDLILLITSVLAAIGVANQLFLSFRGRKRELTLLRTLGMTTRQVRQLLIVEGGFIGLFGGVLAVLLGAPLGYVGIEALKAISVFELHFSLPLAYAVGTVLGAVLVALGASLFPAVRATATSAAEASFYE